MIRRHIEWLFRTSVSKLNRSRLPPNKATGSSPTDPDGGGRQIESPHPALGRSSLHHFTKHEGCTTAQRQQASKRQCCQQRPQRPQRRQCRHHLLSWSQLRRRQNTDTETQATCPV